MKFLLRCADLLSHLILILFMAVVILTALASGLMRHYLPKAEDYRQMILEQINARAEHVIVEAERIESHWEPFRPSISLYGVSVKPANMDRTIHLDKLELEINMVESLVRRRIYFDFLEISRLDLLLLQAPDGSWGLSGAPRQAGEEFNLLQTLDRIWAIDRLAIHRMTLSLKPYGGEIVELPELRATSTTTFGRKQLIANLISGNRQVSHLVLHSTGMPSAMDFAARGYLKTENFPLPELLSILLGEEGLQGFRLEEGSVSNELWFAISRKRIAAEGSVEVQNLDLRKGDSRWYFRQMKGLVNAGLHEGNFRISLPKPSLEMNGRKLDAGRVVLQYRDGFSVKMETLDIARLRTFLEGSLPEGKWQEVVATLDPSGSLSRLHLHQGSDGSFTLQAMLQNLTVRPWSDAPGLSGVSGYLSAGKGEGFVVIDSPQLTLEFPRLFSAPLPFHQSRGRVDWQVRDEEVLVSGRNLVLQGDVGRASAEFHLGLPKTPDGITQVPRLHLVIGLADSDLSRRKQLLPTILDPKLVEWLDRSVHGGKVPRAGLIFHGPVVHTEFEKKAVQLWLETRGGSLTYLEQWPMVEKVRGELLVDDGEVSARASAAQLAGIKLHSVRMGMHPENGDYRIDIHGRYAAASSALLSFLQIGPVSEGLDHLLDGWKSSKGSSDGDFFVSSLLHPNNTPPVVRANIALKEMDLSIPFGRVELSALNGHLVFDRQKGMESNDLSARLIGNPVTASMSTAAGKKGNEITIHIRGDAEMSTLATWSASPLAVFAAGKTPFRSKMVLGGDSPALQMESTLEGVAVSLPPPFGKKAEEKRGFSLQFPLAGKSRELKVVYGDLIRMDGKLEEGVLQAGRVMVRADAPAYQDGRMLVVGKLAQAGVEEWLDVISRYQEAAARLAQAADPAGAESANPISLTVDHLQLGKLVGYGQTLESVTLDLFQAATHWQLGIDHRLVKATLKIEDRNKPISTHLHHLDLDFLAERQEKTGVGMADTSLGTFPAVDFEIDRLIWQGEEYGEWEFRLRSYGDKVALEDIRASVRELRIGPMGNQPASLTWTLGGDPQTRFTARITSDNLAGALTAWGYQQEVHSQEARFDLDSSWPGVPSDYRFDRAAASSTILLKKGNLADMTSTGSKALKAAGLFNINQLIRRIKLDFSDLTSEGLTYDQISGKVTLKEGVFTIPEPLVIKSPSGEIRLKGIVDTNLNQMDMRMGLTLPLVSNLPWVMALAGGLPTAVGVYIISKVMEKQVGQLTSTVYSVKGSVDEPEIRFLRFFDNEMQKQDILTDEVVEE